MLDEKLDRLARCPGRDEPTATAWLSVAWACAEMRYELAHPGSCWRPVGLAALVPWCADGDWASVDTLHPALAMVAALRDASRM